MSCRLCNASLEKYLGRRVVGGLDGSANYHQPVVNYIRRRLFEGLHGQKRMKKKMEGTIENG